VLEFDHDQWPRPCARFTEAPANKLRLQIELRSGESVCDVFVEERADRVEIEVLACRDSAARDGPAPVEIYLHAPLNGRRVIDLSTDSEVPDGSDRTRSGTIGPR
jgi:hypothetical protein